MVYIQPRASASRAAAILSQSIHRLDPLSPDTPKFILGNFDQFKMGKTLKNFYQYVTCATRHNRTLDVCFGTVPEAYRSMPYLPLVVLITTVAPVYKSVAERIEKTEKTVKPWTAESTWCLRGCF